MLVFDDLWKIIEFLSGKISEGKRIERDQLKEYFHTVIESSYNDLEKVHADYTAQLSKLRRHIYEKTLPPYELLDWLRTAGIQYRSKRDALSTFYSEVNNFLRKPANPLRDDAKERFFWYLQQYAKEMVAYVKCTVSDMDVSYYRDYEAELSRLLKHIEDNERGIKESTLAGLFYDTDYVKDMHEDLGNVCDKLLPSAWKRVTEQYRAMRSIVIQL